MKMWNKVDSSGTNHPSNFLTKNLQETRQFNGVNSTTYTAKRGNGFGEIDVGDKTNYWKRLSPCVGYWSTSSDPTPSESVTSPTTTTVKPDYYNVVAILRIKGEEYSFPNDSTSIRDHLRAGIKMYINFSDGTSLAMETLSSNDSCQWSGQLDIKSDPDIAVTGFSMTVDGKKYDLTIKNGYKYTASATHTFYVNIDGETVN